jgi:hypothetical protein
MTPQELANRCYATAAQNPLPSDTDLVLTEAARTLLEQEQELERLRASLNDIHAHASYAINPTERIATIKPAPPKKKGPNLGCGLKVYLVEDVENAPGRILAVMADAEEARQFAGQLTENAEVRPRKLWYGQPANLGYND